MTQKPAILKNRGISPIWILPIVAAIICASLLWNAYQNAGIDITLMLHSASGVTAGKTKVMVRGIPVGTVTEISPDIKQSRLVATVKMNSQVKDALVEDTVFWVVRPQLSASSVTGLETIFSGSYINMQTGESEVSRREFIAAEEPPPPPKNTPGLHVQLQADELGSLQAGSGIYFSNVLIGEVEQTQLNDDSSVIIQALIKPRYEHLVHSGSRFCNASGLDIRGTLSSVEVHVESMAALLRGGIQLFTPTAEEKSPLAKDGDSFKLYANYAAAEYGLPLTLDLSSSDGIVEGVTKVMYRGLVAGVVKSVEMNQAEFPKITAHIQLDPRAERILRDSSVFWLVKTRLSPAGVDNLDRLISGAYITFRPGKGQFRNHFTLLPAPPPQLPLRPGRSLYLTSTDASKVTEGSPISYKNIQVGEVVAINVEGNSGKLTTHIYLYEEYLDLLNRNSVFWLQSGVRVKASARTGLSVETGPLATMFFGGISFATPQQGKAIEEGDSFPLYSSYGKAAAATPVLQQKGRLIQLIADKSLSLSIGAPLLHKSVQIGEIRDFRLDDKGKILLDALVYKNFDKLVTDASRFYYAGGVQVSAGLSGVDIRTDSLLAMAAGGISMVNIPGARPKKKGQPWQLYTDLDEAQDADGFAITVILPDTAGLREQSPVIYKGIDIGRVISLKLDRDMKKVQAGVRIQREARDLFREGTMLWVEGAEINMAGVKNPQALLFGAHLSLLPGDGKPADSYIALARAPLGDIANADGLGVVLETTHLGSISAGSPVYYREIKVGEVTGYELSPTFQKVQIFISIKSRFAPIVRENTRFWNISGARIEGGIFSGVTVQTGSLESIIKGGIAFATPDNKEASRRAKPGQRYLLHETPEEDWLDWEPDVQILEKEDAGKYLNKG
jgi:paraquat-inducible protein B